MKIYRTLGDKAVDAVNVMLLALFAVAAVFPFFYVFSVSFSTLEDFMRSSIVLWPKRWAADAYHYILQNDAFVRSLFVTVLITVVGTLVNLFFTSTMAYALSRRIVGHRAIMFVVVLLILFPPGLIPVYIIVKNTGLINTIWAVILPVAISPTYLIIMRLFFGNLPSDLFDAARIDGANEWKLLTKVVLPLSKPVLAAFSLFYAVLHWNNYFSGMLFLNNPNLWPIQVVLRQIIIVSDVSAIGGFQAAMENPPPPVTIQMAAIIVATLPILVFYPFLQKHFAKGVMLGSVKG